MKLIRLPWWLRQHARWRFDPRRVDGEGAAWLLHAMHNPPTGLDSPPYVHVFRGDEPQPEEFDG